MKNPTKKEKEPPTYLRNIGWCSEPGGVFGLAPEKRIASVDKSEQAPKKKKKKGRPRRKKKSVQQNPIPETNPGAESSTP